MSVKIDGHVKLSPSLERFIHTHKHLAPEGIERGMEYIGQEGTKRVKETIMTQGLIRKRKLYKSIDYELKRAKGLLKTIIGTNVFYAHILEGGASPDPFKVKPRKKKALYWRGADHPVKAADNPGTRIKAYNFMGGTIEEMERVGTIEDLFSKGVQEAINDLIRRGF
jgi:hypothetical protein